MPLVVWKAAGEEEEAVAVDVPLGGSLGDLSDEHDAPVPFSCRSATCGTCRVVVLEGAALLTDADDDERALLELFGDDTRKDAGDGGRIVRLACQAKVLPGPGRLVLRPVADD